VRLTTTDVDALREYLGEIRDLLPRLTMDTQVGGGATAGQLAFHSAESADHWVRYRILGDERPRDREAEFAGSRTRDEVAAALERAFAACDELVRREPELGQVAPKVPPDQQWTVLRCLLHVTAHTAVHAGHLQGSLPEPTDAD
jgi:DinB superfamily